MLLNRNPMTNDRWMPLLLTLIAAGPLVISEAVYGERVEEQGTLVLDRVPQPGLRLEGPVGDRTRIRPGSAVTIAPP